MWDELLEVLEGVLAKNLIGEDVYIILDAYRYVHESENWGSKTVLKLDAEGFFVAYGACIRGFMNMRKFLAVDGTSLTGKYDGVLLIMVEHDTDNNVYPVIFCVVYKDCNDSWAFFSSVWGL